MVRLDRGGRDFLSSVTSHLGTVGVSRSFSPALYRGSTRIWERSGYEQYASLEVMERSLALTPSPPVHEVVAQDDPDWGRVLDVDRRSFEGFWGMSEQGLREALSTNRTSTVLVVPIGDDLAGFAVVGSQWGATYLHRIAVDPAHRGQGVGSALLARALTWGRNHGATMILNVRRENEGAKRLYEQFGFVATKTTLIVLRHELN